MAKQAKIANKAVSIKEFQLIADMNGHFLSAVKTEIASIELLHLELDFPSQGYSLLFDAHLETLTALDYCLTPLPLEDSIHTWSSAVPKVNSEGKEAQWLLSLRGLILPLHVVVTSSLQETASYPGLHASMSTSLTWSTYSEVDRDRRQWQEQRSRLRALMQSAPVSAVRDTFPLHVITYSSEDNAGLDNLLTSADIAGIRVTVGSYILSPFLSFC